MPLVRKTVWSTLKDYFFVTLGILLYVTGWCVFLLPNNLIGGGVTGIASIVQYATGLRAGYTYGVLNVGLIIAAIIVLGKNFGVKTVYAIILAAIGLNTMQDIIPYDFCITMSVENGKLMSTIMGAIMVGVSIGMTMAAGGSTGGTDIIALMVNKYRNVSPGRLILLMDVVIMSSSLLVPSYLPDGTAMPFTEKVTTVVYGLIMVTITSTVLDLYLSGSKQSVQLFILSQKYDIIADAINNELHRGCTVLSGQGWYSKNEMHVLMVLTRKSDLNLFLRYVKTIDPDAFLSVSLVTGVYGKGFDTIKKS